MADPATVFSIINELAATTGFCYQIIKKMIDAPEEINRLNSKAANWRPQLERLAEFMDGDGPSATRLRDRFKDGALSNAKDLVQEMNKELAPFQKINPWKKFIWSLTTGNKVRDLLKQLQEDMDVILDSLHLENTDSLERMRRELCQIQLFETNEHERRNILQWLKPKGIDAHEFHRQKRALREDGTCDWLAESKQWQDWCVGGSETHARFLWIHGLPGAGKTVLASFGIDNVASAYQHKGVSYYYCSHERHSKGYTSSEETCSLLRWVIRDLTAQVTRPKTRTSNHQAAIPQTLEDLYIKHDFSLETLLDCLLAVTEYIAMEFQQQVCIIVDAVDESPSPREDLLKVLTTMGTDPKWQHVSLCFTSRKETDIERAIEAIQPNGISQRIILTPKPPSKKPRSPVVRSGFDGAPPPKHAMSPPPRSSSLRGRSPSGSDPKLLKYSHNKMRSESEYRLPSGHMSSHQSGKERSTSVTPAENSHSSDLMEIDTPGHAIARGGKKKGCTILSMDKNPDVIRAIRAFVQSRLEDDPTFKRWGEEELSQVINQLAKKAKGMFRWAACQVDIILKSNLCDTDSILQMLDQIPPDIFGTYKHMIMHLLPDGEGRNEHNRNFAHTALALICSPTAAVPCAEVLVEASRFNVPAGAAHIFDLEQLEEILGCLVTVTSLTRQPETLYNRDPDKEGLSSAKQVSVAHYTVKEFLFDKTTALGQVKDFALSKTAIQSLELRVIFSGLQQFGTRFGREKHPTRYEEYCLKMTEKALREQRDIILQDKTVWHAVTECLKWNSQHHLKELGAFPTQRVRAAFPSWSKTSPFECKNDDMNKEHTQPKHPQTSVLVSLILLEWPELAKAYLAELPESTKKEVWKDKFQVREPFRVEGTEPQTVMQLCVTRRDVAFLQALIDSKADFSGERELIMDLFYHAYGHKSLGDEDGGAKTGQMLKMLLERGVRPETTGYLFTPLQFAVAHLEEEWVYDLLYEGADPNAIGNPEGEHPFGDKKDKIHGHLTPLQICQMTRPNRLESDLDPEQGPMEKARETVNYSLRQWGAEDKAIVVDDDSE
ncbi:hypothetical protein Daus18300_010382 [Diaporthe australafricana]|uniref:Nephrocystin 3-like N-terminal domain-containing protein n=1 Tax=Diaporthe australafricana TaxID=127596 RepID=A0ABR3WB10_9PEZI